LRIKKEPDIPVQQKQQHFKAEKRKKRTKEKKKRHFE